MNRIKLRITVVTALAVFLLKGTDTFAQQTDPTLTGAVFAQTSTLKNIYDKRQKAHEKIIAAETAVTVALDRVHSCLLYTSYLRKPSVCQWRLQDRTVP